MRAALAVTWLIQSGYHGITGIDAAALAAAGPLFAAAMLLASGMPAARAARLNPIAILKHG